MVLRKERYLRLLFKTTTLSMFKNTYFFLTAGASVTHTIFLLSFLPIFTLLGMEHNFSLFTGKTETDFYVDFGEPLESSIESIFNGESKDFDATIIYLEDTSFAKEKEINAFLDEMGFCNDITKSMSKKTALQASTQELRGVAKKIVLDFKKNFKELYSAQFKSVNPADENIIKKATRISLCLAALQPEQCITLNNEQVSCKALLPAEHFLSMLSNPKQLPEGFHPVIQSLQDFLMHPYNGSSEKNKIVHAYMQQCYAKLVSRHNLVKLDLKYTLYAALQVLDFGYALLNLSPEILKNYSVGSTLMASQIQKYSDQLYAHEIYYKSCGQIISSHIIDHDIAFFMKNSGYDKLIAVSAIKEDNYTEHYAKSLIGSFQESVRQKFQERIIERYSVVYPSLVQDKSLIEKLEILVALYGDVLSSNFQDKQLRSLQWPAYFKNVTHTSCNEFEQAHVIAKSEETKLFYNDLFVANVPSDFLHQHNLKRFLQYVFKNLVQPTLRLQSSCYQAAAGSELFKIGRKLHGICDFSQLQDYGQLPQWAGEKVLTAGEQADQRYLQWLSSKDNQQEQNILI